MVKFSGFVWAIRCYYGTIWVFCVSAIFLLGRSRFKLSNGLYIAVAARLHKQALLVDVLKALWRADFDVHQLLICQVHVVTTTVRCESRIKVEKCRLYYLCLRGWKKIVMVVTMSQI
ncbi:uncharacterized protein LOC130825376 [Amaranthus tricolor]|uniref:uncharacterized protein LOC130825376 n=1 Tax=Amaranthus tricolor TaxID=29722 RepID=UPI00258A6187|nr:uncharacterized protein LOC130825376 [Amaranthus tricolor]